MNVEIIRKQLAKFIEKNDLKPYHLADLSGVSRPAVYKFLAGKGGITLETAIKLIQTTRKSKAWVMENRGDYDNELQDTGDDGEWDQGGDIEEDV